MNELGEPYTTQPPVGDVPPGAIEAAAEALDTIAWPEYDQITSADAATEALLAALPAITEHLREKIAGEIEAEMRRLQTGSESPEFDEGMSVAADLVREGRA